METSIADKQEPEICKEYGWVTFDPINLSSEELLRLVKKSPKIVTNGEDIAFWISGGQGILLRGSNNIDKYITEFKEKSSKQGLIGPAETMEIIS